MESPQFFQADAFAEPTPLKSPKVGTASKGTKSPPNQTDPTSAESVTGGADSWYTRHIPNTVRLSVYNRELQFRFYRGERKRQKSATRGGMDADPGHAEAEKGEYTPPVRKGGDIVKFSRKSRLRLLRVFNRIHHVCMGTPIFLSLTARPECFEYTDPQEQFHKTFIPMLRHLIPKCEYVWKMEPHKDGRAHWHMIVWSGYKDRKLNSEFYKRKIRQLWRNCIEDHSRSAELYSCKIEKLNDERGAFNYLSKYMFKEDTAETASIRGRRWGKSATLPISPIMESAIPKDRYEKMKNMAIELIEAKKRNVESQTDWIKEGNDWFVWFEEDEIEKVLLAGSCHAEVSMLKRWRKTGSVGYKTSDLADLAAEFGHDF